MICGDVSLSASKSFLYSVLQWEKNCVYCGHEQQLSITFQHGTVKHVSNCTAKWSWIATSVNRNKLWAASTSLRINLGACCSMSLNDTSLVDSASEVHSKHSHQTRHDVFHNWSHPVESQRESHVHFPQYHTIPHVKFSKRCSIKKAAGFWNTTVHHLIITGLTRSLSYLDLGNNLTLS